MTRANSLKKLNHLLISLLDFTEVNNFLNDSWSNLHFQKFFVVVNETNDGFFSSDGIYCRCIHSMIEIEVDPLTYIQLILIVPITNGLNQVISTFANHHDFISCTYF